MRDHGGDLDRAQRLYGEGDWLDLSTGINPIPYPLPEIAPSAWAVLPTGKMIAALEQAAREAYHATCKGVALAGASAAIQLVPRLRTRGQARVLGPTYNEHAAALSQEGWAVEQVPEIEALAGADLAVVVNPNNPDGLSFPPARLIALARQVGLLVVDESFADCMPELSVLPETLPDNMLVLRSFGKFYGLAGVRLGFAFGANDLIAGLRQMAGPWAVSGPACACGLAALSDEGWRNTTLARLRADAAQLDTLTAHAGWRLVGGTPLFRTYKTNNAAIAQDHLARGKIWSRRFPYSESWLRLGMPAAPWGWERLEQRLYDEKSQSVLPLT